MTDAAIVAENLGAAYGASQVLSGLWLSVRAGEFLSIVGQSGAGKTTLLDALAGFVASTGEKKVPKRLGVVFQDYAVFPWMTVAENIAFGLGQDQRQPATTVMHMLRLIGLEDRANDYPAGLSAGQIQRVGIARALAPAPEAILMDEPFGRLDPETRERMQGWLLGVWEDQRLTVVMVTHDVEEAILLSDRILLLRGGRLDGERRVPFGRPRHSDLRYEAAFVSVRRDILAALHDDGTGVLQPKGDAGSNP